MRAPRVGGLAACALQLQAGAYRAPTAARPAGHDVAAYNISDSRLEQMLGLELPHRPEVRALALPDLACSTGYANVLDPSEESIAAGTCKAVGKNAKKMKPRQLNLVLAVPCDLDVELAVRAEEQVNACVYVHIHSIAEDVYRTTEHETITPTKFCVRLKERGSAAGRLP